MRRLYMVTHMRVLVAVCVVMLGAAGCDQIPFLKPRKPSKTVSSSSAPAAAPSTAVHGTVIAKVNNIPITLEDMNQEIEAYNSLVPADKSEAKITTREQKVEYVKNQMVRSLLLYQEALDRRLDESEEVQRILDRTKRELLVVELLRKEAEGLEVTSQEIEESYNTYKDRLKEPEERQIREIVVASESEAKEILIQLLQGGDFSTIARERSIAASKKDGGNLGFIKPGQQKSSQFDDAAFSTSLETGSVSSIFKGPEGYYIIKLEAKHGGKQMALSDVWDNLKRSLTIMKQQQKMEELVGKLSRDAKIEISEGEIK